MTAEDILRRNPRFLTRSKSFDTFFSFGPEFVTSDEIDDVESLEVATRIEQRDTAHQYGFQHDVFAVVACLVSLEDDDPIAGGLDLDGDTRGRWRSGTATWRNATSAASGHSPIRSSDSRVEAYDRYRLSHCSVDSYFHPSSDHAVMASSSKPKPRPGRLGNSRAPSRTPS